MYLESRIILLSAEGSSYEKTERNWKWIKQCISKLCKTMLKKAEKGAKVQVGAVVLDSCV